MFFAIHSLSVIKNNVALKDFRLHRQLFIPLILLKKAKRERRRGDNFLEKVSLPAPLLQKLLEYFLNRELRRYTQIRNKGNGLRIAASGINSQTGVHRCANACIPVIHFVQTRFSTT